jgi:hypothetical protein
LKLEEFIFRRIQTVDHLRAILLLHTDPTRAWDEAELAGRLYLEPKRVTEVCDALVKCGLASRDPTGGCRFQQLAGDESALFEQLVTMDRERPVSLIRMIYNKPDTLEAFSDAFRLRRNQ